MAQRVRRGLWRNVDFVRYWAGETISLLGTQITIIALPLLAAVTLHATPFEMGLLVAAETAPFLVLSLPAGVWVDRIRRRPILVVANVARAVLLASIPVAAFAGRLTLAQLYAVAVSVGAFGALSETAYQAYLPSLVRRPRLLEANTKLAASRSFAEVAGPGLAGAVVALATAAYAIALNVFAFVAAAVLIAVRRRPEPRPRPRRRRGLVKESAEGIRFVTKRRTLRVLVVAAAVANLVTGAVVALKIVYMARTLGLSAPVIGGIVAVQGISALLAAAAAPVLVKRVGMGRTFVASTALFTVGDVCLALAAGPWLAIVALLVLSQALIGAARSVFTSIVISLRQALTPDGLLGRVTAASSVVSHGTLPLGALLGGAAGQVFGLREALIAAAVATIPLPVVLLASHVSSLAAPPVETPPAPVEPRPIPDAEADPSALPVAAGSRP